MSSMVGPATFQWVTSDGVAGECPEWQRELTVNQPPHGFVGSSPTSPTIPEQARETAPTVVSCLISQDFLASSPLSNRSF
jgi:hypothetical protein